MTDRILPGIIGGPCLPVGLALAAFSSLPLLGGVLVVCGVVLLVGGASIRDGGFEPEWREGEREAIIGPRR